MHVELLIIPFYRNAASQFAVLKHFVAWIYRNVKIYSTIKNSLQIKK